MAAVIATPEQAMPTVSALNSPLWPACLTAVNGQEKLIHEPVGTRLGITGG